jgi:hypothetical protein
MCYCKCPDGRGMCKIRERLKNQSNIHERMRKNDAMSKIYGSGFITKNNDYKPNDMLLNLAEQINNENLKGGGLYDNVSTISKYVNIALQTYKDSQKYEGEMHVPLYVNGTLTLGSYIGPGTNLIQRLKNDDKAKSYADLVSKLHDINYTISQTAQTKDEQKRMVREADNLMLNQIQSGKDRKLDNRLNLFLASAGISSKVKLEDKNIPFISNKLHNIAGDLEQFTQDHINLLNNAREETLNEINNQIIN